MPEVSDIEHRIAKRLRVDPSYVFRVGYGERNSEKVVQALEIEMKRLDRLKPQKNSSGSDLVFPCLAQIRAGSGLC
jgi:hypothetical protein